MTLKDIQKVLVIGAGGTGSILLPQLARFLRSESFGGKLIIADGDAYSDTNANRQQFSMSKVGMNKAEYQALAIVSQLPDIADTVEFLPEYLDQSRIEELVVDGTIVINCVDNRAARKFVEDQCQSLDNSMHICCGNELSTGQVQVSLRQNGEQLTPDIYKQSPNFNSDNDDRSKLDCEELAALPGGGQLIAANMMAATLALNYIIQYANMNKVSSGSTFFNCYTNSIELRDKVSLLE